MQAFLRDCCRVAAIAVVMAMATGPSFGFEDTTAIRGVAALVTQGSQAEVDAIQAMLQRTKALFDEVFNVVPSPRRAGTLIVCERLDENGRPVNAGTLFAGEVGPAGPIGGPGLPGRTPDSVTAVYSYTNMPAGTVECVWKRDGRETGRTRHEVRGDGRLSSRLYAQSGGLLAGDYEVTIVQHGRELARQRFRITAGPPGPAGPRAAAPTPPAHPGRSDRHSREVGTLVHDPLDGSSGPWRIRPSSQNNFRDRALHISKGGWLAEYNYRDGLVQVEAENVGRAREVFVGLVFRLKRRHGEPEYSGYSVAVSLCARDADTGELRDEGSWALFKKSPSNVFLTDWETSDAINVGPGASNTVGVVCQGDRIEVMINGECVGTVYDSTYPDAGKVGPWATGARGPGASGMSMDIAFRNLLFEAAP